MWTDHKQVQTVFSDYLDTLKSSHSPKNGTIGIIDDSLTRLPPDTIKQYVNQDDLIIIKTNKQSKNITNKRQVNQLDFFPTETKQAKIKIKQQIDTIIEQSPRKNFYKEISLYNMLLKRMNAIIDQIEMAEQLLNAITFSTIIISSPNHFSRVMAFVSTKNGIPTICLQHGIIGNEFGYLPKVATIDAVYGQFEKDWFLKCGVPKKSVRIIGHPRFDQAQEKSKITKLQFCQQLKIDKRKKTLLMIVRGKRHLHKWQLFIEALQKQNDINIILRDFPTANNHPLVNQFPHIQSTKDLKLYDILPHVDAVVSYPSTVALEAMLVGKSVFILRTRLKSYTGYFNNLSSFGQGDPSKLASIISFYFRHMRWRKTANKIRVKFLSYAYPDRQSSGARLWQLVQELSKKENH